MAMPDPSLWRGDDDEPDMGKLFERLAHDDGNGHRGARPPKSCSVAPPQAPVVVHGRVTHGGEPVARAQVVVLGEGSGLLERMRGDTADDAGAYDVRLNEPGDYTFVVMRKLGSSNGVDFPVTIPKVKRHELDLELPAGSIAGVVWSDRTAGLRRVDACNCAARMAARTSHDCSAHARTSSARTAASKSTTCRRGATRSRLLPRVPGRPRCTRYSSPATAPRRAWSSVWTRAVGWWAASSTGPASPWRMRSCSCATALADRCTGWMPRPMSSESFRSLPSRRGDVLVSTRSRSLSSPDCATARGARRRRDACRARRARRYGAARRARGRGGRAPAGRRSA